MGREKNQLEVVSVKISGRVDFNSCYSLGFTFPFIFKVLFGASNGGYPNAPIFQNGSFKLVIGSWIVLKLKWAVLND